LEEGMMNHQDKKQYLRYLGVRTIIQGKCILLSQRGFPVSSDQMDNVIISCCKKSKISYISYKEFDFAERFTRLYFEHKNYVHETRKTDLLHDEEYQGIFDQYLDGKRHEDFSRCSFEVFINWYLRKNVGVAPKSINAGQAA
jgi:hypothetical protein